MIQRFLKNYPFIASLILIFFSIQVIPYALNTDKSDNIATKLIMEVNYYPTKLIDSVKTKVNDSWDDYVQLVDVKRENELLRDEVHTLRREFHELEEVKKTECPPEKAA